MRHRRTIIATATASALAVAGLMALPAAQAGQESKAHKSMDTAAAAVESADIGGTAWGKDKQGRLLVSVDKTVSGAEMAELKKATDGYGKDVRIKRASGTFRPLLAAGDAIHGSGYRCSLGFNVRSGNTYSFLTAGHCGKPVDTWYADAGESTLIGPTTGASFPNNDYALVSYANDELAHPGGFTAGEASVGQSVTREGSTTGTHRGTVTALDATVHYSGGGTVRGMIQTDVCAEPGDSGGPLYSGSTALGLTSGGSGNCSSGGTTFYQPVTEALAKYKVSMY